MYLGSPFAFALGGVGLSGGLPWIVNLFPSEDQAEVKLLDPVRFSIRDAETYINPSTIRVEAGYADVFSNGTAVFDNLPSTKRVALAQGNALDPLIRVTSDGVQIQKTSTSPQRSVYATSIEAGAGYANVMVTAIIRPDTLTPFDSDQGATPLSYGVFPGPLMPLPFSPVVSVTQVSDNGTVLAIEHGPRNKVVYLRFQKHSDGSKLIRLTSAANQDGSPATVNTATIFDWDALRRYTAVWNEAEGYFEFYGQVGTITTRIFRLTIDSIPSMPDDYFIKAGSPSQITVLYGQLGPSGDASTWANIAVTTNVGYPVLGNVLPGSFVTQIRGTELLTTTGDQDPREALIGTWSVAPSSVLPIIDSQATSFVDNHLFELIKATPGSTFAFYREEPGFLTSNSEGFMVQAHISAQSYVTDGAATGMGFVIFDGASVFHVQLFDDLNVRTIGILKKVGTSDDITEHYLPLVPLDWADEHLFRLVVDPRRNVIQLFDGDDLGTERLSIPFDRATLPNAADFGWVGLTPFIMFGHTAAIDSTGTFVLKDLSFCHLFQSWEAEDGDHPTTATPPFVETLVGSASSALDSENLIITTGNGGTDKLTRSIPFGMNRGAILEARMKVLSWRPRTRSSVYLFLDDGIHAFALTFVENNLGKFVALSQRGAFGEFKEMVGRDGYAATISFLFDWTAYHTYRVERRPYDGVYVFVDDEEDPRISFPETSFAQLPDTQTSGIPSLGFGHFSGEGAVSRWAFVRGMFSRGYEISFKKNEPDTILRNELFNTQAIIVAHASDADV